MTEPQHVPLRALLVLLAASALVPFAVTSGVGLYLLDTHYGDQTRRLGIDTARALSTAVDAELDRAVSVLQALGSVEALEHDDVQKFREHAQRIVRIHPEWLLISLSSPQGEQLLNTRTDPAAKPSPVAEPDSLRRLVVGRVPVVGALQRGPAGTYAVPVRVPVMTNGALRYVLSGVIKPDAFLEVVRRQKVSADWVVSIFDAQGTQVARSRAQELYLGTPAPPHLQQLIARTAEGSDVVETLEGEAVFTGFSRSAETGWTVTVGIPQGLMQEASARTLGAYGSGLLMSLALGLVVLVLIARRITVPMAGLRVAARTLARREVPVPVPTRIAEIHEVGAALVAAGEERARIEGQRERLLAAEQEARAAAERANRFKDEFVSMLSHELRNPIAAIANAARLLEPEHLEPAVAARARDLIRRQAGQLGRLADELLVAESALQGRIVLEPRRVDFAAAAREVLDHTLAARGVDSHRMSVELEPVWVRADPMRLEQIVARLLDNAFKFTPDGGSIRVSTKADGGHGVLVVADSGIGMTPELAQRVFEPLAHSERALHRPDGGLGIGLALVRRLTELHEGPASARSAGPAKGAEFEVRLPRAPVLEHPASTEHARPAVRPCGIVIVEDNEDARTTLRLLLEAAGHRVRAAPDGVQGLQAVLDEPPDIALIDIGLPRMDGFEVARRIHEAFKDRARPTLVAVTGYGLPDDRERAMAAGFDVHLVKPIDHAALEAILARLS